MRLDCSYSSVEIPQSLVPLPFLLYMIERARLLFRGVAHCSARLPNTSILERRHLTMNILTFSSSRLVEPYLHHGFIFQIQVGQFSVRAPFV
jgi:hypothetical protein